MRPATRLVKTIECFRATVIVRREDYFTNAKSILGLLGLGAGPGTELTFTATGPDAMEALEAIGALFTSGFKDAYESSQVQELHETSLHLTCSDR